MAPQRNAANAEASSRTDSRRRAVRSIPYTAPASSMRSQPHWIRAADFVGYEVPSSLSEPIFSPCTGEYRGSALHCIQSTAASSSQPMPVQAATSRYRCSPRPSGAFALANSAVVTACGSCAWYRAGPRAAVPRVTRAVVTIPLAVAMPGTWAAARRGAVAAAVPAVPPAVLPAVLPDRGATCDAATPGMLGLPVFG